MSSSNTREYENCPREAKYLCGSKTLSRGLCVSEPAQCDERSNSVRPTPSIPENVVGKKYAYVEDYLGRHCYFPPDKLKLDYEAIFEDGEPVPETFAFLTYNIWGLAATPNHKHLFQLRKDLLEKTIRNTKADILCLQEMSEFSYQQLEPLIKEYKFASEVPYPASTTNRNRSVDTYVLSKYKPSRVAVYGLPAVLGYEDSVTVIEFPNLIAFNLYNQAGSKHSPGQQHKWLHYSRCRYDILQTLYDLIVKQYSKQNVILCGDFNFDLDGDVEDWPELEMIHKLREIGFIDTFRTLNPKDPGFTEDTDLNFMRFNQKLMEKHYRYDAVLYKPAPPNSVLSWALRTSQLVGVESQCLDKKESEWFLDRMSEAKGGREHMLKGCKENKSDDLLLPINPSDHFGVLSTFGRGRRGGRRRSYRKTQKRRKTRKLH